MSERYGPCHKCGGEGKIYIRYETDWDEIRYAEEECPRCEGTGMSGDAMDKET